MTFLDAYALIGFLTGGAAVEAVTQLLRGGDAAVTTMNLAETCDVAARRHGIPVARVMEFLDPLLSGHLRVVALDLELAARAGALRARHYNRTTSPISLADAVLLASASAGDRIATADAAVLRLASALGLEPVALT